MLHELEGASIGTAVVVASMLVVVAVHFLRIFLKEEEKKGVVVRKYELEQVIMNENNDMHVYGTASYATVHYVTVVDEDGTKEEFEIDFVLWKTLHESQQIHFKHFLGKITEILSPHQEIADNDLCVTAQ